MSRRPTIGITKSKSGDIERWRLHRCDYRRKRKDILTRYEVCGESPRVGIQSLIHTAMTASQMRIAETIDAFYGDAGAKDGVSRSYKQAVEDLDAETIKALDGPYRYAHTPEKLTITTKLIAI
jgi:hypothetical protein